LSLLGFILINITSYAQIPAGDEEEKGVGMEEGEGKGIEDCGEWEGKGK